MSDEDEGPAAEVIELRPGQDAKDDERHIVREPHTYGTCRHKAIRLDPDVRRAYCRACDQEIPCFDYLMTLAADWERFIALRREAQRRMEIVRAHLDDLLRDERNAKARRRHWKKHEPEAVRHLRAVMELVTRYRPASSPETLAAQAYLSGEEENPVAVEISGGDPK